MHTHSKKHDTTGQGEVKHGHRTTPRKDHSGSRAAHRAGSGQPVTIEPMNGGEKHPYARPQEPNPDSYDREAQVDGALLDVLARAEQADTLYYACGYLCPRDSDGTPYYVDRSSVDEEGSCMLTLGLTGFSVELDYGLKASTHDGTSIWHDTRHSTTSRCSPDEPFPGLLWVGRRGSPERDQHIDDTSDQRSYPAYSLPSLGAQLEARIALLRSDITLCHDPDWAAHPHPLEHIFKLKEQLKKSADNEHCTLNVADQGRAELKVSGQAMDVLLEMQILHQRYLDSLTPFERDFYHYERHWMDWTDGTFRP